MKKKIFLLTLVIGTAGTSSLYSQEPLPRINGVVVYANNWGYNARTGLYEVPTQDGAEFEMMLEGPNGSSVVVGDRVYTINHVLMPELDINYPRYTVYNLKTGSEIYYQNFYSPDWTILPVDMDVDPISGDVYGITYNSTMTGYQLSKFTFTDNSISTTTITPLDGNWNAMAFDAEGQLYAISKQNIDTGNGYICGSSKLNKINRTTGEVTVIGETGQMPEYPSSAAIDRKTGKMYWTISPLETTGLLAEVDLSTGHATILRVFEHAEEVVGLYVPASEAEDDAPNQVLDLQANFPQGAMSGYISFVSPSGNYNGSTASGELNYHILVNGVQVLEGATEYDAEVIAPYAFTERGNYEISVTVSNSVGSSPVVAIETFIGTGTPDEPIVGIRNTDGHISLVWYISDQSADGGYIDFSNIKYNVKRFPGAETVATGLSESSYEGELPEAVDFTKFHYGVEAVYDNNVSVMGTSAIVTAGSIHAPYTETFDDESSVAGWRLVDANNDRRMWMWSTLQNLRISFSATADMDDWIITPPVFMEAGKTYTIGFDAYCDSDDYIELMEVKAGEGNQVDEMTKLLSDDIRISSKAPQSFAVTFAPETTRNYYIGFHGISPADQYMINFDNFSIKEGGLYVEAFGSSKISIVGKNGILSISGTGDDMVEVYSAGGLKLYSGIGNVALPCSKGLYIVRINGASHKVVL